MIERGIPDSCEAAKVFCTVVTEDYLPFAATLAQSISKAGSKAPVFALVSCFDADFRRSPKVRIVPENLRLVFLDDLCGEGVGKELFSKYSASGNGDNLRWSLKPLLMRRLLGVKGVEKVFFADCDIYFVSSPDLAFDLTPSGGALLTPHWYPYKTHVPGDTQFYTDYFKLGVFNAGAMGAAKGSEEVLDWWADICLRHCDRSVPGCRDDQGHLTVMRGLFPNVQICTHRGFNVASWNRTECRRTSGPDGRILINGVDDLIFVHFAICGTDQYIDGVDPLLLPCFLDYVDSLLANGLEDIRSVFKKDASVVRFSVERLLRLRKGRILVVSEYSIFETFAIASLVDDGSVVFMHRPQGLKEPLDWSPDSVALIGSKAWLENPANLLPGEGAVRIEAGRKVPPAPGSKPLPFSDHFLGIWRLLRDLGMETAIFGAGKQAETLLQILAQNAQPMPSVILDDAPKRERLWGVPVRSTAEPLRAKAVVIASDAYHKRLRERAVELWPGLLVIDPYRTGGEESTSL